MLALDAKKVERRLPYRLYHERGIWKSCYKFEALELMRDPKWHDKTNYLKNEEVLKNESENEGRELYTESEHGCKSKASNKRKKS